MNLLEPLSAGIRGARNGTVAVYSRGTTTAATVYADNAGVVRRVGTINLDVHGCVEAYVNELVDVVAYDSAGAEVRSFTAGTGDRSVEVISPAFTGYDYEDATSAVDNPTTLERVFAGAMTSFGAVDWNVAVGTTSVTLRAALAGLTGVFVNVMSGDYGTVGDGASDDTAAVQAAVDAAAVNGGIVFFPAGTYKVSSRILVPKNVSLLGAGAQSAIISTVSTTLPALYLYGFDSDWQQSIEGLQFTSSSLPTSVSLVDCVLGVKARIVDCAFGGASFNGMGVRAYATNASLTDDRTSLSIVGCVFVAGGEEYSGTTGRGVTSLMTPAQGSILVDGCTFVAPNNTLSTAGYVMVLGNCVHVRGSHFYNDDMNLGSLTCFATESDVAGGRSYGSISECTFSAPDPAVTYTYAIFAIVTSSADAFYESGNLIAAGSRLIRADSQTGAGLGAFGSASYYAKAGSYSYYEEVTAPASNTADVDNVWDIETSVALAGTNMTSPAVDPTVRMFSADVPLGARATVLCYDFQGGSLDAGHVMGGPDAFGEPTDMSSDASASSDYHYALPSLDQSIGTKYWGWMCRMVRAYGATGPTLRSRWHCTGMGATTKTAVIRKSY